MDYDALVVGGGAAGLSAALVLGRARRRTLLIDAGAQSNLAAHQIGGLLGQPSTSPAELYAAGRAQLAQLPTVELLEGTVATLEPGFRAVLEDGSELTAARVLLAGGMNYELPDTPGLAELWGNEAFMCPYCHGWEHRDERIALLGTAGLEHRVPLLREWTDDVVVLGDDRPIASVAPGVVRFEDGGELEIGALHVVAQLRPRDGLAAQLGVATRTLPDGTEIVEADAFGATSVDGVFAAGDITTPRNVAMAIGTGNMAATGLHRSLVFG